MEVADHEQQVHSLLGHRARGHAWGAAQDVPGLLPRVAERLRLIWNLSAFYATAEHLTGLLRRVSNAVINVCTAAICVPDALSGAAEDVVTALQVKLSGACRQRGRLCCCSTLLCSSAAA